MKSTSIFDIPGFLIFLTVFLITVIFIFIKTALLFDSFSAGAMNGLLFWLTYITFKMCYLASKKNK